MKKIAAAFLTTALLLAITSVTGNSNPNPPLDESCSCTAADGSCSVSITCNGGCERYCGIEDDCWAECSGFYGALATETSLEITSGTYAQLTTQLARISGKDISFSRSLSANSRPDFIANLGFKKAPLWSALEFLSKRGTVKIAGKDFESLRRLRKSLLAGDRVNFGVKNTPVHVFVNDLAGITGVQYRIVSGRPMALANVELREATLEEIVKKVGEETGTRILDAGNESP